MPDSAYDTPPIYYGDVGSLPPLRVVGMSPYVREIAQTRAAAIEALLKRSADAARAHCQATATRDVAYPILRTNGANPLEAREIVTLHCGVCEAPIDGFRFEIALTVGVPDR